MKKNIFLSLVFVFFCLSAWFLIQEFSKGSSIKVDDNLEVEVDLDNVNESNDNYYVNVDSIASIYNTAFSDNTLIINGNKYTFNPDSNEILNENGEVISTELLEKDGELLVSNEFLKSHLNLTLTEDNGELKINSKAIVPILMYHTVNDTYANDTINTTPINFESQIKALSDAGFTGITPFELYDYYFNNGELPEKPILITFDDGYKDNYTNAYPILKKYGMQATIFVIASRIEHEGINTYPTEIPKITWEDAKAMSDLITIQSHTWDSHRKIETKSGKLIGQIAGIQKNADGSWETEEQYKVRITDDLLKAQSIIKEEMNYESVIISYPYGEANETVFEVASNLGAKLGVTVKKGVNYSYDHLMSLKRITVDGNFSGEELVELINSTK